MIARMSVAPDALSDLSGTHPIPVAKAQHETLARALEAHGLLVFANRDEEQEFVRAAQRIGTAPPGVKDRWLTILTEMKKSKRVLYLMPPSTQGLADVAAIEDLRRGWGGRAQVAVLPTKQATALGVDGTGLMRDAQTKLEVAAAPIAAYCHTLAEIRELTERAVLPCGASRDDFWTRILMPIAVLSRRVVVLDQYLFGGVFWHHQNLPRSTRWDPGLVVWLLRKLDQRLQPGAEVVLVGTSGADRSPVDARNAAQMVEELWRPAAKGRIAKVEAVTGPWRQGRDRMPHDRHIRFSAGAAVKSLPGFDRLGQDTVQDPDGMGWQYHWKPSSLREMRDGEKRVGHGRESSRAMVLDRTATSQ